MFTFRKALKKLATETSTSIKDLLALSGPNDPYYMGSPAQTRDATWLADLWNKRVESQRKNGITDHRINLRGLHYYIQAIEPELPVQVTWKEDAPNGRKIVKSTTTYINNFACWKYLCKAVKAARYLKLVPAEMFFDGKGGTVRQFAQFPSEDYDPTPKVVIEGGWDDSKDEYWSYNDNDRYTLPSLPELNTLPSTLPNLPYFSIEGYHTEQKYILEIWVEKSDSARVLNDFCEQNNINLVVGQGELSITACLDFIQRVKQYNKPVIVLYVSDYDPAGFTMPKSVSRKIEYFIDTTAKNEVHVKLMPIVLTKDQIIEHSLPSVPAKLTDNRVNVWNETHGENSVVELDSLEALYPGLLTVLCDSYVSRYLDPNYTYTVRELKYSFQDTLQAEENVLLEDYHDDIEEVTSRYKDLLEEWEDTRAEFADFIKPFQEKIDQYQAELDDIINDMRHLSSDIKETLEDKKASIVPPPQPNHDLPNEDLEAYLFDSDRTYFEQLRYYNARKQNIDLNEV